MVTRYQQAQLGTDIYQEADFRIGSNGDLCTASGIDGLKYRIDRMLLTAPGEIFHRPDWGVGIIRFLNRPNNANTIAQLRNAIIRNVSKDPDVERVVRVGIKREEHGVIVSVELIAKGGVPVSQAYGFEIN